MNSQKAKKLVQLAMFLGVAITAMGTASSFVIGCRVLFTHYEPSIWALLSATLFLIGGIQLFFIGLFGDFARKALETSQRQPQDVVEKRYSERVFVPSTTVV